MRRLGTLVILAGVGLACHSDDDRGGREPPTDAPPADPSAEARGPAAPAVYEGPGQFLPRPDAAGYRITAAGPRYFDANNLYTYMDGQSDAYIEYGIVKLAVAEYHPASGGTDRTVQVEVYDMGTALGAFGRWSRIAVEGGDPAQVSTRFVEIGGGGVASGTDLAFWQGRYLGKLTYLDESPDATEETLRSAARTVLLPIARVLAGKLPVDPAAPPELARFPAAGLMPHSQVRYGRALLGLEAVGPGFGAEYLVDGKRMRAFFALRSSDAEGTSAFDALKATLTAAAPVEDLGDTALKGTDAARGEILIVRKGALVTAITNSDTPDAPAGDMAAKIALARGLIGG